MVMELGSVQTERCFVTPRTHSTVPDVKKHRTGHTVPKYRCILLISAMPGHTGLGAGTSVVCHPGR